MGKDKEKVSKKKPKAKKKVAKPKAKPKEKPKVEKKVEKPKVKAVVCNDKHCPKHGNLSIRGRIFIGTVIKDKMAKSIIVEWPRRILIPKYERYTKKRSRVAAHNPTCINAKVGDKVKIAECRPISKTKSFVVIEVMK